MARVKRGVTAHKRHKRLLNAAEGRTGHPLEAHQARARSAAARARVRVCAAASSASASMRALWIVRLNAAARQNGLTYSKLISGPQATPASPSIARSWPTSRSATRPPLRASPRSPRRLRRPAHHLEPWTSVGGSPCQESSSIHGGARRPRPHDRGAPRAARRDDRRSPRPRPTAPPSRRIELDVLGKKGASPRAARHRRVARPRTGRRSAPSPTRSARPSRRPSRPPASALGSNRARRRGSPPSGPTSRSPAGRSVAAPCIPSTRRSGEIAERLRAVRLRRRTKAPEVETDELNFQAAQHPAPTIRRATCGTRSTSHPADHLRTHAHEPRGAPTHTSPGQIRGHARSSRPSASCPGRCFRYEAVDASHAFEFFQVEGLMVDEGTTHGRPQGPARPVRARDVRGGPGDALPTRLLPVHRAVGRVRHPVRRSATGPSARPARRRAG